MYRHMIITLAGVRQTLGDYVKEKECDNLMCSRRANPCSAFLRETGASTDSEDTLFCQHALHRQNGKDTHLIRNKFLAWKYVPVVRELYERLR